MAELFMKASGTDGNGGPSNEFTLFSSAIAALSPGDTLILRNGVYTPSTNGRPTIIGGSTAAIGTPSNRITVMAENLGQAIIASDGQQRGWIVEDLVYWDFIGLTSTSDDTTAGSSVASIWDVRRVDRCLWQWCICSHTNRWKNAHAWQVLGGSYNQWIDCQIHKFHRHGIMLRGHDGVPCNHNLIMRPYGHSHNHSNGNWDGPHNNWGWMQPNMLVSIYPSTNQTCNDNLVVNAINEDDASPPDPVNTGMDIQAQGPSYRNKYFGCIGFKTQRGYLHNPRGTGAERTPKFTELENNLYLNNVHEGLRLWRSENTEVRNITVWGANGRGIRLANTGDVGSGVHTINLHDCISAHCGNAGFIVEDTITWSFDGYNDYNNGATSTSGVTNRIMSDPNLGDTQVWVRPASPSYTPGYGANILFAYDANGVLTDEPLWDAATGQWRFVGPTVDGITNVTNRDLGNVHTRLGISGASLPDGYGIVGLQFIDGKFVWTVDAGSPDMQDWEYTWETDGLFLIRRQRVDFSEERGSLPDGTGLYNEPSKGIVWPTGQIVTVRRRPVTGETPGEWSNAVDVEIDP